MKTTTLGKSGLEVSRIAFGTWQLSGEWGATDTDAAADAIRHAHQLGVNFFDTAQAYGFGASEQLLGRALRNELKRDRESIVLATKGGIDPRREDRKRDSGATMLRSGVQDSLKALGVDYIDLYQIHWPDLDTPFEETAGYLQELVDDGLVRHVGVSNYDADQLAAFEQVRPAETLQPPYHLFRRSIEDSVLPYCVEHDVGVLVYSPLGSGLLTGSLTEDSTFEDDDWRSQASAYSGAKLKQNLAAVEELKQFAAGKDLHISQLAIAWALAKPGVDVAIVGARSAKHIESSLAAADVELTADDIAEIERIAETGVQVEGAAPEGVV